jgi:hypothetical protein
MDLADVGSCVDWTETVPLSLLQQTLVTLSLFLNAPLYFCCTE